MPPELGVDDAAATEVRRTFCRFCHAGCPLDVEVDVAANRVLAVRGVPDDPVYGGYTCVKGRHLGDQHHHPDRLRASLRRGPDGLRPIATGQALDAIADALAGIVERHGPRAFATYCGTAAYQSAAGLPVARAFHQALGSPGFYTSASIDQPAKFAVPFLHGMWAAGVHTFSTSDVAMVVGCNTLVSTYSFPGGVPGFNPFVRLREAKARGLALIVVDPRRTELAQQADLHLAVRPGEDPTLLAGILRQILAEGGHDEAFCRDHTAGLDELRRLVEPFTLAYVEDRAGVPGDQVVQAARRFAAGPRGAVSTGTGPNMAPHPTLTELLAACLNTVCGRYHRAGEVVRNPGGTLTPNVPLRAQVVPPRPDALRSGPPARVRGLHAIRGEAPTSALADEILEPGEGQVRALVTLGGNPVVAWPDQRRTVAALGALDLHVVVDAQLSASARLAHFVLASTLSLERPDVPTTIDRWYEEAYSHYTPAVLAPDGDLVEEWQVFTGLAARLGLTLSLPGGTIEPGCALDTDDVLDLIYVSAKVPLATLRAHRGGVRFDELATVVQPGDPASTARLDLAPAGLAAELATVLAEGTSAAGVAGFEPSRHRFRLTSRRLKSVFNSSGREIEALRRREGTSFAHLHPDDLASLALADGDTAEISSPHATIRAVVRAAPDLRQGTVSMAHAWGGLPDEPADPATEGATTGALVDVDHGFDPVTGMPIMSAIPVEVRPVR